MFLLHILAAQALAVVSRHHFKVMSNGEDQIKNLKEASEEKNIAMSDESKNYNMDDVEDEIYVHYASKDILEFLSDKEDKKSIKDLKTVKNYANKFLSDKNGITSEETDAFIAIKESVDTAREELRKTIN